MAKKKKIQKQEEAQSEQGFSGGFLITNCKDIDIRDSVVDGGHVFADIENSENIRTSGNVHIPPGSPPPPSSKRNWNRRRGVRRS